MLEISLHVSFCLGNALCLVSLVQRRPGNGFDVFGDLIRDAAVRRLKNGGTSAIGLLENLSPDSPHISARDAPSGAFILTWIGGGLILKGYQCSLLPLQFLG